MHEGAERRRVDVELVAALNARDLERWLRHIAADAKMLPPGAPAVEGRDAIRGMVGPILKMPGFAVAHHLQSVNVSRDGDLAWVSYAFELTVKDAAGKGATEKGKDIAIYRITPT